jgi:cytochrome c oxidase assembly protein subunit 15
MLALTATVLAIGTVVTGSGPHAGDKGARHRIGLDPAAVSQLHADVVMLLIGVSLGFAVLAQAAGASARLRRAGWMLVAVELAQGLIGFVQYFTHVPAVLVGVHMLGACLVWLAALTVLAETAVTPAGNEPSATRTLAAQRR